jgi:hypothetical protein
MGHSKIGSIIALFFCLFSLLRKYPIAWYCMDRVSSCSVYVVQQDTQCSFMVEFIHNIYQLYSVSDLTGPSSGASFNAVWADW